MIYAENKPENKQDLTEIFEAIRKAGVPDDYIKIGMEYLDTSKPRDVSVLKKIKPVSISQPRINGNTYEFNIAVAKRISRNDELFTRYVQFAFSVAKSECWKLDETIAYVNRDGKLKNIFAELVNDESKKDTMAEAMMLAVSADKWRNYYGNTISPEIHLAAALFSTSSHNIVLFCAYALANTTEYDDIAKTCIKIIKEGAEFSSTSLESGNYKIALAECVYFDDSCRGLFRKFMENIPENLVIYADNHQMNFERILQPVIDENIPITVKYIEAVVNHAGQYNKKPVNEHLRQLALRNEKMYISAMKEITDAELALNMLNILQEIRPEYLGDDLGIKEIARKRHINFIYNASQKSQSVYEYITGKKTLDEVINDLQSTYIPNETNRINYYKAYGLDDVVRKTVVVGAVCLHSDYWSINYFTGYTNYYSNEYAEILFSEGVPVEIILDLSVNPDSLVPYAEQLIKADTSKLTVAGRSRYINALAQAESDKYKSYVFAMAGDTSKAVKQLLIDVIPKIKDCQNEVIEMLSSKKAVVREIAVEVIAKMKDIDWSGTLAKAVEKEKSEKLRVKMLALLGTEQAKENKQELSVMELAEKLTKGSKGKKIAWLYQYPYSAVHFVDGSEVPEKYMQALLICYADSEYATGKKLAENINKDELAVFSAEVFGRWVDAGAVAKNKWVLTFSAVYGKSDVISAFVKYIKEWSENMRGAIAVSAVKALALNGSSEALMQVDSMARKYKSNQVKSAANEALIDAAEFLGITIEELGDRIVPDFNFDDRMCRVFDYGNRKFNVYLTPALEIEIYNGDKKIKNLPKPSANDITEIAEKSYAEYKEMKKQLKKAVALQKTRLEYTLMCDRKWTAENWEKLFVKNPVMHCFAIGLIWGIYENGKLVTSFRYLDDGSFTTVDEDEFEIPENAEISLVHPVELSENELAQWTEQLMDYEIVQPFAQLSREVYRPETDELNGTDIKRFFGKEIINQTLAGRMENNGWYRGMAEDGGCFYEFYREDISRKIKSDDGAGIPIGFGAELTFSGSYIGIYQVEAEEVEIEKLSFYKAGNPNKKIPVSEVSDRYFSEVIRQITAML